MTRQTDPYNQLLLIAVTRNCQFGFVSSIVYCTDTDTTWSSQYHISLFGQPFFYYCTCAVTVPFFDWGIVVLSWIWGAKLARLRLTITDSSSDVPCLPSASVRPT